MQKLQTGKTVVSAAAILALFFSPAVCAQTSQYRLIIERKTINITGKPLKRITINGSIPGPTLRFTEGDEAVIHVANRLDEDSSVHWHGLILPGEMDGVPGLNGFAGIGPGQTFTYRFKVRQHGTYWYHAHSVGQEQDGHYGSIIIEPRGTDPVKSERDYVVLLSDFHEDEADDILSNLKMSSEYYQNARRTIGNFFADVREKGLGRAWGDSAMWGGMNMMRTDLSDVTGYTFLANGKTPEQNWTALFKPGERVRLRFINASAMSFFDVRIPGLTMTVVSADGQYVEPVETDEFRFGVAETYDVIVAPKDNRAYTIVAESIDRTGFALATLATRRGMRGEAPQKRTRSLLTTADMGMSHAEHDKTATHAGHDMLTQDGPASGWAQTGAPPGTKTLSYKNLRYLNTQKDLRPAERTIEVRLGGNMERYIWTLNGKKRSEASPINLKYGERVRLSFVNKTMMAHPMHLHGMFVQLENGQPAEKLPNKHTVVVAPGDSYSVLLTADEPGEWAFHCHLLYHMMSGMMNEVVVAKLDPADMPNNRINGGRGGNRYEN